MTTKTLSDEQSAARRTVGAEIKKRRRELHLTQKTLGERAKVSAIYLGKIEAGSEDPSLDVLQRVAASLGISVAHLLGPIEELTPKGREMSRLFGTVPPHLQDAILKVLHALATKRS